MTMVGLAGVFGRSVAKDGPTVNAREAALFSPAPIYLSLCTILLRMSSKASYNPSGRGPYDNIWTLSYRQHPIWVLKRG